MAVNFTIKDFKCFNQLRNGANFASNTSEYTTNLVGNVGEKLKVTYSIEISWDANASAADDWYIESGKFTRASGNFKKDGFVVGDKFSFYPVFEGRNPAVSQFTADVDYINGAGNVMEFTVTAGSQTTLGDNLECGIAALVNDASTYLTASLLKFGILGNDEAFNFINKVSQNQQIYYAAGIDRIGTPENYIVNGIYNSWVTGSATIANGTATSYEDEFLIEHEFILLPYYENGQLTNLQNNILPELFEGNESLKYALQLEMRKSLTNIDSAKIANLDELRGVVGWFNENFNGFQNNYEIVSIAYEKVSDASALTGVSISERTKVTITVSEIGASLAAGQVAAVYFSYLPESESEYQDTTTDYVTNFIYDNIVHTEGTGTTAGTDVFKSCTSSIVGGDLVIVAELELSAAQMLKVTTDSYYLLSVQIEDSALSVGNSDRVNLIADVEQFTQNDQVAALITWNNFNFYNHAQTVDVDTPTATLDVWNEDGVLCEFDFDIDLNNSAVIDSLQFALVAQKTTDNSYFILDTYTVNLGGVIVSGGVQQIEIDTTRGYPLALSDQFNFVKITTGANVGGQQNYTGEIGIKITWQTWVQNLNVDTVFYNNSEPNDNLNLKASNYDGLNSYEIKLVSLTGLTGLDENSNTITGVTPNFSGRLTTYDYDEDNDGSQVLSGVIETYDESGTVNLNGNILRDANTLLKCVYTSDAGSFSAPLDPLIWGINRIEEQNQNGFEIYELSSIATYTSNLDANNPLTPESGETTAKLSVDGSGNLVVSCLIDYTKLKEGVNYKLSGRIDTNVFPTGMLFEDETVMLYEDGTTMLFENQ